MVLNFGSFEVYESTIYLMLTSEFLNRISTYQYGLAAMTYHVETIYVMTYGYIDILWQPYILTHTFGKYKDI